MQVFIYLHVYVPCKQTWGLFHHQQVGLFEEHKFQ